MLLSFQVLGNLYSCTYLIISNRGQILHHCSLFEKMQGLNQADDALLTTGCSQTLHPAGFGTLGQVTLLGISFFFCVAP